MVRRFSYEQARRGIVPVGFNRFATVPQGSLVTRPTTPVLLGRLRQTDRPTVGPAAASCAVAARTSGDEIYPIVARAGARALHTDSGLLQTFSS